MLQETIAKIEANVVRTTVVKGENRDELLQLLATLKSEIDALSKTNSDQAQSIAGFTQVSTHEASRPHPNPELLDLSLQGLSSSVAEFEGSNPQLVSLVNRICLILSNMGI